LSPPADDLIRDVSDTALWVAACRAIETERPDALFRDPLAGRLAGERGRQIAMTLSHGKATIWSVAIRTVVVDAFVTTATAAGVDTIVNLGAGLDTRPHRMDLPGSLRWIEVDYPSIIDTKMLPTSRPIFTRSRRWSSG
jgi:methyltransferase (TIGR00027 family)